MRVNEDKARRSFNYQCKRASKCRHESYQVSCNVCPTYKHCDIQAKIDWGYKILHPQN